VIEGIAEQLGRPSGSWGRLVGVILNRRNKGTLTAAVDALGLGPGAVAADVGFGGGIGLELLIKAVGRAGHVHGVELSPTMLAQTARRFQREISEGRLELHEASMTRLPLKDASLDGVVTVNTIYFVADLPAACAEFARLLKGTGRVIIGLGDPTAMTKIPFIAHGFRLRPVPEVIDALHAAGLAVQADRRVGEGEDAVHLLVAVPAVHSG